MTDLARSPFVMRMRIRCAEEWQLFRRTTRRPFFLRTNRALPASPKDIAIAFVRIPYVGIWCLFRSGGRLGLRRVRGENGHSFFMVEVAMGSYPNGSRAEIRDD